MEPALAKWRLKEGGAGGASGPRSPEVNHIPLQETQVGFQRGETCSRSNNLVTGGVVLNAGVKTQSAGRGQMRRLWGRWTVG